MEMPGCFARPNFLVKGQCYYLRLPSKRKRIPVIIEVKFTAYTACPAVVVVRDARQEAIRCKREDLFTSLPGE